jgi:hypothetical protein
VAVALFPPKDDTVAQPASTDEAANAASTAVDLVPSKMRPSPRCTRTLRDRLPMMHLAALTPADRMRLAR